MECWSTECWPNCWGCYCPNAWNVRKFMSFKSCQWLTHTQNYPDDIAWQTWLRVCLQLLEGREIGEQVIRKDGDQVILQESATKHVRHVHGSNRHGGTSLTVLLYAKNLQIHQVQSSQFSDFPGEGHHCKQEACMWRIEPTIQNCLLQTHNHCKLALSLHCLEENPAPAKNNFRHSKITYFQENIWHGFWPHMDREAGLALDCLQLQSQEGKWAGCPKGRQST